MWTGPLDPRLPTVASASSVRGVSLFDRRLLVVSGKGGVGKTTVSAAAGIAAARSGRRVLIVELGMQQRLFRLFNSEPAPAPGVERPLYPGVAGMSIDPQQALEEYLMLAVRIRAVAERLAESRTFGYVAAAVPGLRELVTLGKLWHLTEERNRGGDLRYDVVVLDAPATGHGILLLRTPRAYAEIARTGRVRDEAKAVAELVEDPERTGIVLVTTPDEIPVTETIEAHERLRAGGLATAAVIINALYPDIFSIAERERLELVAPTGDIALAALQAARSHSRRRANQEEELQRLVSTVEAPFVELPCLFVPDLDIDAISELARLLQPAFEVMV